MSYNRLSYDTCEYKKRLQQSVGPLQYVLNPMKYENCNKCRHEFGLVDGPAVSQVVGNLVDLENDLRGQTRQFSLCPSMKYQPSPGTTIDIVGNGCNQPRQIDITKKHLPSCQFIRYKPVPLPPKLPIEMCPGPKLSTPSPCFTDIKPVCR